MLIAADGFEVSEGHMERFDIMQASVGTDPTSTLKTRRGTGYYTVPSLRGVWYRGPFEHNGSVATLEDWFDPARLRDDYVPTGYIGHGVKTRAVPGHRFGLELSADDKKALIAFLRTLSVALPTERMGAGHPSRDAVRSCSPGDGRVRATRSIAYTWSSRRGEVAERLKAAVC